jgi:hypothetical protein
MNDPRPALGERSTQYVEKIRLRARLSQPNLDPRDGWFLLFPQHGKERRTESLLEHLNSERHVIPFILSDDNAVLLLTRTNIDWVAVSSTVDRALIQPDVSWNKRQRVELRFLDERRVEADVEWHAQNASGRLSDFLNSCSTFVLSKTGFGTLIWNRRRVREVRVLTS